MAHHETLTITLPEELLDRVRTLVAAGVFPSEEQAILVAIQEATQWAQVPDGSHASLEDIVGEVPDEVTQLEKDEEPV